MEPIALRPMGQEDLPAADALRRAIGWNQTLQDWRRLLSLEPEGSFVALRDGAVVGTVTTITYGLALAWIGMMLVHPEQRRQGIASRLMIRAIEYLREKRIGCIKLDATPAGRPLYERLGFVSEWSLTRWQLSANPHAAAAPNTILTRRLEPRDWPAVEELDRAAFGVTRPQLLRSLAQDSDEILIWPVDGAVLGWGMLRPGANADYLGPLTCLKAQGVQGLLVSLLHATHGRSVYWDIPDQNEPAKAIAHELGFVPLRPLTRMYLGSNSAVSDSRLLFGIADPAVG